MNAINAMDVEALQSQLLNLESPSDVDVLLILVCDNESCQVQSLRTKLGKLENPTSKCSRQRRGSI